MRTETSFRLHTISIFLLGFFLTATFMVGCSTLGKPVEAFRTVEGQIDYVGFSKVPYKDDFLSVTHIGFTDGQGVSLGGVHPGLSKGKTVKLNLKFHKVLRGTPYYEKLEVPPAIPTKAVTSTEAVPATEKDSKKR